MMATADEVKAFLNVNAFVKSGGTAISSASLERKAGALSATLVVACAGLTVDSPLVKANKKRTRDLLHASEYAYFFAAEIEDDAAARALRESLIADSVWLAVGNRISSSSDTNDKTIEHLMGTLRLVYCPAYCSVVAKDALAMMDGLRTRLVASVKRSSIKYRGDLDMQHQKINPQVTSYHGMDVNVRAVMAVFGVKEGLSMLDAIGKEVLRLCLCGALYDIVDLKSSTAVSRMRDYIVNVGRFITHDDLWPSLRHELPSGTEDAVDEEGFAFPASVLAGLIALSHAVAKEIDLETARVYLTIVGRFLSAHPEHPAIKMMRVQLEQILSDCKRLCGRDWDAVPGIKALRHDVIAFLGEIESETTIHKNVLTFDGRTTKLSPLLLLAVEVFSDDCSTLTYRTYAATLLWHSQQSSSANPECKRQLFRDYGQKVLYASLSFVAKLGEAEAIASSMHRCLAFMESAAGSLSFLVSQEFKRSSDAMTALIESTQRDGGTLGKVTYRALELGEFQAYCVVNSYGLKNGTAHAYHAMSTAADNGKRLAPVILRQMRLGITGAKKVEAGRKYPCVTLAHVVMAQIVEKHSALLARDLASAASDPLFPDTVVNMLIVLEELRRPTARQCDYYRIIPVRMTDADKAKCAECLETALLTLGLAADKLADGGQLTGAALCDFVPPQRPSAVAPAVSVDPVVSPTVDSEPPVPTSPVDEEGKDMEAAGDSSLDASSAACDECGTVATEAKLYKCSRCLSVRYCSKECQRHGWSVHKHTCASNAE